MQGGTHFLGGVAATAVIGATAPECLILGGIGGLLPDIDIKNSKLGRYNPFAKFMSHRGFCHSLVFVALITFLCTMGFQQFDMVRLALPIGMLSHLALDMLNKNGIQLFWPFGIRLTWPIHGIKSGGTGDLVTAMLLLGLIVYVLYPIYL